MIYKVYIIKLFKLYLLFSITNAKRSAGMGHEKTNQIYNYT